MGQVKLTQASNSNNRSLISSEFCRISATLSLRLAEAGWTDDVHHHTKGMSTAWLTVTAEV
jgi:hypothetical protein